MGTEWREQGRSPTNIGGHSYSTKTMGIHALGRDGGTTPVRSVFKSSFIISHMYITTSLHSRKPYPRLGNQFLPMGVQEKYRTKDTATGINRGDTRLLMVGSRTIQ
ncbi:hypothetical protein HZ326_27765 [Fusarium oxysporum f. sp. albedinis]|nr:hypothetical protein HZ326_27765 [Fusarium oxysporum f. sp. albedinis]